jgi:hypothetical protein
MQIVKNFVGSKMNKGVDERLLPNGQYVDGLNIRVSSDESGQAGSVENSKGNELLTALEYNGSPLSSGATCIGALQDGDTETVYWFVTDPGVVDMIVSYNTEADTLTYHVISTSVLNFSDESRMNGINLIDNLLFFTDNLNPPRRINVETSYPQPIGGVDQIDEDDISVIVKPPLSAPTITTIQNTTDENYMEDKFISFAYRYKYKNNEYSATSPFSNVAFTPNVFDLNTESLSNQGMLNIVNQATVSFDVGPANVIGVDVLFKETNSTIIKVIERFNKSDEGWTNNSTQSINFDNRKIYTTLTESELLRLYDNVPRLAKAQTSIGNRIMYGNYVDGYDVINPNARTPLNYSLDIVSNPINKTTLNQGDGTLVKSNGTWSFPGPPAPTTVTDGRFTMGLGGLNLVKGGVFFISLSLEHSKYIGVSVPAAGDENEALLNISITLSQDYATVADFYNSDDFSIAINGVSPPRAIADCGDGYSLTDLFNCGIVEPAGWEATESTGFPSFVSGDEITIKAPAITFEQTPVPSGVIAYEYLYVLSVAVTYREKGQSTSLHSDRDYEIGLVYMDDYARASTVQVCNTNNIYIPKSLSDSQNTLQLTINHAAPSWATRYKPVIKETYGAYETIYARRAYKDNVSGSWFIKLVGDNVQKVSEGDFITVKADGSGASLTQPKIKVLSVGVKEENFINQSSFSEPSGVYMEVQQGGFTLTYDPLSLITYGDFSQENAVFFPPYSQYAVRTEVPLTTDQLELTRAWIAGWRGPSFTYIAYPAFVNTITDTADPDSYEYSSIPAGSLVKIYVEFKRDGDDRFKWEFDKSFTSAVSYDNLYDFIIGENIDLTDPSNDPDADSITDTPVAEWDNTIDTVGYDISGNYYPFTAPSGSEKHIVKFRFCELASAATFNGANQLYFSVGTKGGGFQGDSARLTVRVDIDTAAEVLVFETEPQETDGIIYYENEQVFDVVSGSHQGNVQNQSIPGTPAIVDLNFFNCYAFGNGVESFKIRDELAGMPLTIGTRAHAVANEEYKEARRFADITYSGVYNQETNLNKLNEFNLALVNYKPLDQNFGPIEVMHARISDILVLQEDKISYVLANGKNLFSDATAGASIINTPEVLGQQVPRIEQYGISNNPESFAAYGPDVFFTDAKRNAVINLRGGSSSEQLNVISMLGLRSWFRDLFKDTRNGLKLGGFDPYSNEYVLSSVNDAGAAKSSTDYTLSYSPSVQGWPSFYSFIPEHMIGMNSYFYSFNEGNLYRHNTNESRNNFYGVQYTSKITAVVNDAPSEVKVFKTISLESNSPWDATITSDLSSGYIDSTWFSLKDGDYFAHIRRTDDDDNFNLRSTQGIGQASTVDAGVITAIEIGFGFNIDSIASVGDKAYQVQGGGPAFIGDIVGISGSTITIDGTSGAITPSVGGYILYVKNNIAESYGASGYYMQYELENTSNNFVELFAVGTELFKSNP